MTSPFHAFFLSRACFPGPRNGLKPYKFSCKQMKLRKNEEVLECLGRYLHDANSCGSAFILYTMLRYASEVLCRLQGD